MIFFDRPDFSAAFLTNWIKLKFPFLYSTLHWSKIKNHTSWNRVTGGPLVQTKPSDVHVDHNFTFHLLKDWRRWFFFDRPDFSPAFVSPENCFNVAKKSFDRSKKLTKHGGRSKIWGYISNRRSFKKKGFASINAKDWGIIVYDPSHCFELGPILKTEKPKRPILSSHYHN